MEPYAPKRGGNASQRESTFMPYNKSILTRVIAQQLQKNNVLVFSHHTKRALQTYLKQPVSGEKYQPSGPARGMFNALSKIGVDQDRLVRKKLSQA